MEKVVDYLKQLDLSEIEAKIYLTLLETGPISVRELAKLIDAKRTTIYAYIDQLVEKGLLIKIVKKSRKQIAANQPEDALRYLAMRKLQYAKTVQDQLPLMLGSIKSMQPQVKDLGEAEIKYYKGESGVKKIYDEAFQGSELRLYANLAEMSELLQLESDLFEKNLSKNKNLKIFEIVADDPQFVAKFNLDLATKNGRYSYKFIPTHVGLTAACILLYDNKVAIINVREKTSSVVLYNEDYYTNSKNLFDFIWSILPELKS